MARVEAEIYLYKRKQYSEPIHEHGGQSEPVEHDWVVIKEGEKVYRRVSFYGAGMGIAGEHPGDTVYVSSMSEENIPKDPFNEERKERVLFQAVPLELDDESKGYIKEGVDGRCEIIFVDKAQSDNA